VLAGETPNTDNAEALVRLCGGMIAGHRNRGIFNENPEETCAQGKT